MSRKVRDWIGVGLVGTTVALIVRALCVDGANSSSAAGDFSSGLVFLFLGVLATVSPERLHRQFERERFTLAALGGLVAFIGLTLVPLPATLAHPIYGRLGLAWGARSIAPYRAIEGLAALSGPVAAYAVGALVSKSREDRDLIGQILLAGGLIWSLVAFALFFRSLAEAGPRLAAGVGANGACTTAGTFAVLALSDILRNRDRRLRRASIAKSRIALPGTDLLVRAPLGVAVLVLSLAAALLTQSRGGLTSTCVGLVVTFVLYAKTGHQGARHRLTPIAAALVLGGFLVLAAAQIAIGRVGGTLGEDFATRLQLMQVHAHAFLDQPLFGHGLNSFHEINAHYSAPVSWLSTRTVGAAHNVYIQWLEETGLIGGALMTLIVAPLLWRASRALANSSSARAWAAGALGVAAVCGLHGLVDFGLEIPAVAALFAFALGAFSQPLGGDRERRV